MQISLFNGFADKNPKPITIREVVEIIRADQRLQVLTENHRYGVAGHVLLLGIGTGGIAHGAVAAVVLG